MMVFCELPAAQWICDVLERVTSMKNRRFMSYEYGLGSGAVDFNHQGPQSALLHALAFRARENYKRTMRRERRLHWEALQGNGAQLANMHKGRLEE